MLNSHSGRESGLSGYRRLMAVEEDTVAACFEPYRFSDDTFNIDCVLSSNPERVLHGAAAVPWWQGEPPHNFRKHEMAPCDSMSASYSSHE
jgi:hypothetical protein